MQAKDVTPKTKAIQGLSKSSFSKNGLGNFTAPTGNTLMIEDQGIRVKEVEEFKGDLSRNAQLKKFEKPNYTEDAIDAELESTVVISVYIDKNGQVIEAELEKKVGFGMDQLLIRAALNAKFLPRLNKFGKALPTWDEIVVRLEIP